MTEGIISKLNFNGRWRTYQQRVLNELKHYLNDKKLNVVAAPGAGKTTLGIEVIKMLGKPVLILAPTITIRNQWKYRICTDFLSDNSLQGEISTDAKEIKPITILTYQLIHSIFTNRTDKEKFITNLKKNGIKTVILDEAHHLRTEWYNSLIKLCSMFNENEIVTVSLTGTPPYDVSPSEWNNYNNLCGHVDAEISIPELVKSGDLAPHQDLIWFSKLELDEEKLVQEQAKNREIFLRYLKNNAEFLYAIKASPFLRDLEKNVDLIYKNTNFTLSLISYLLYNDNLDMDALTIINFLSVNKEDIPPFYIETAQTLINGMLGEFEQYFKSIPAIKEHLKELNLLESAKRVNFLSNISINKIFSRSSSKLKSIKDITDIEFKSLKNDLREVILLDYIGQNNRAGVNVLSVFNSLTNKQYKTGILSGTIVVIPKEAKDDLYKTIEKFSIKKENVLTSEYRENHLRIESYGNINLVEIVTELFYQGKINVLVGTQALLGEGWDSPCVNSLILASTVGSFMLSNQMRGRAIRTDKNNPDKISDIWHLACLSDYYTSPDLEIIEKRFKTFEGISFIDTTIQNGIDRLGLSDIKTTNSSKLNKYAAQKALNKFSAKEKWSQAFNGSVITERNFVSKIYEVAKTKKLKVPGFIIKNEKSFWCKNIVLPLYKKIKLNEFKKQYAYTVTSLLKVMCESGTIQTPFKNIKIDCAISNDFTPFITLTNCSNFDRKLFVDTIGEFFAPADDQRYIFKRENKYIAVPDTIGTNKKFVTHFAKYLSKEYGYLDIIFTRSPEGRRELLKAKYNPMFDNIIKTSRIWI